MKIMAIDPGINGGIAWTDGEVVRCAPMPEGMTVQTEFIWSLATEHGCKTAIVEQVGTYQPGNSGPAAATFARHCGNLDAILYCYGISTVKVLPKKWMASIGTMPKDKQERKRAIKEAMARRYPHLSVTLKTADALGMLTWGMTGSLAACQLAKDAGL